MNKQLLNRREFNGFCLALGASFVSVATMIAALPNASARAATRMVKFHDGTVVAALGLGTSGLAVGRRPEAAEEEALRTGLSLGMAVIDTAEIYGDGGAEKLIGRVIAGQRDDVFLVSKILPTPATGAGMIRACEASLARIGTDHLDLYLLHWQNGIADLSGVVTGSENLHSAGKIRAVCDMEDLFRVPQGDRCATNQVHYNLSDRSIERDLLPWCEQHGVLVMAYSPLGAPGRRLTA